MELLGFVAGLASVWLYTRENPLAWPAGIVNSGAWAALFWESRLFLDAGLQLVFVGIGAWGWWQWLRGGPGDAPLRVRRAGGREAAALAAVAAAGTGVLWWAMTTQDDAMPFWDAATTTGSLVAQYLLGRKVIGTWRWWIAVDVAYVGIYAAQELYLTAALQPVFIVLCMLGLRSWRVSRRDPGPVPPGTARATGVAAGAGGSPSSSASPSRRTAATSSSSTRPRSWPTASRSSSAPGRTTPSRPAPARR